MLWNTLARSPSLLGSTNSDVGIRAIAALGEFGTASRDAVPILEAIAGSRDLGPASYAIQVLPEIDPAPARFADFLAGKMDDTNLCMYATFALGRIWPEGTLPLIRGLTNENKGTRYGCISALAPKMRSLRRCNYPSDYRFRAVICEYNSFTLATAVHMYQKKPAADLVVPSIISLLNHPNPTVRMELIDVLSRYGEAGIPGLSLAANDTSKEVRQRALGALAELQARGCGGDDR
jgi:FOG: HEAT repeat